MVSKGNHLQMALIQVSELLKFPQMSDSSMSILIDEYWVALSRVD